MKKKKKIVKSCKSCYCRPVCQYAKQAIDSFLDAAQDYTGDFIKKANIAISISLAEDCKYFASSDDKDFKCLEEENQELRAKLNKVEQMSRTM